ncbi:MAG: M48 family metallopeptidase [Chlorobiaceae bacterium]|nr:M48 family metallopeptidase [Chlorobiaceae bacterium]NTW73459.1 M48 family metallopeptidase [Chlorobiaceae bacterium]
MNIFGLLILLTLVGTYMVRFVADLLNLRAASPEIPEAFRGVYEDDAYRRSQEYLRATTRFSLAEASADLLLLLLFWFSGGFDHLDRFVRGFGFDTVPTGVLYTGALLMLQSLTALPFRVYKTFILEERFGFNKTTPRVFVTDMLKAMMLGMLLGTPLLALIIWFFEHGGPYAWLWVWSGVTLFSLLLQYVAPSLIMPMFNKFTPLQDGSLRESIMHYAASVRFPLAGIYVIDGSKRSSKANAFFTGFGRHKRIALFDTLISNHTEDELVAVLAHEIGHFRKRHILVSMLLSTLNLGMVFFLLSQFMNNRMLFDAFFMQETSVYASLLFFMLLYTPVEFVLSVLLQMLSRRHEFQADRFAVTTFAGGRALATALKKLSRSNLSNLTPHPFYVFLNYSHPPVLQRILRIEAESASHTT